MAFRFHAMAPMKSMALARPGRLTGSSPLAETTGGVPTPGVGEILIRVGACGVCRTDLQICEGDIPPRKQPVTPGHQIVGRVEAVGPGVSGWSPGDRAGAGWLASTCGVCAYCRSGRENLCPDARFTGWDQDGGYATHAVVRGDFAFHLPDGLDDLALAPLLCGGVIGYRSLKRARIERGGVLGLYGFGASALLTIQVATHWGCRVHVCTRSARERERALRLGAAWAGGYDEIPPEPLDAAVTFAPSGDVVVSALRATARGGTVAVNAIHLDRIPQFSYDLLWLERNLVSVANYTRDDAREFLKLAAEIPIETETDVVALNEANGALARLRDGKIDGAAVLRVDSA
jgi:propanol-preferring alcohol dehydrogenase